MRFALLTLVCCALVTALPADDSHRALGGWVKPTDAVDYKVPHGDIEAGNKIANKIGNGDGGGLNIDTGGGDIGEIGLGVATGVGSGNNNCQPCDDNCQKQGGKPNSCMNGGGNNGGNPSVLGLLVG
ncbi:hypothetical protein N7454_002508 [Penicillium verhagenii]|nr:hypothetical protein N7454_002508 [Penicillium verhagenii]